MYKDYDAGDITMRNFMNTVAKELTAFKEGFKKGYNEAYRDAAHNKQIKKIGKTYKNALKNL